MIIQLQQLFTHLTLLIHAQLLAVFSAQTHVTFVKLDTPIPLLITHVLPSVIIPPSTLILTLRIAALVLVQLFH
jgi:hypothetical protein